MFAIVLPRVLAPVKGGAKDLAQFGEFDRIARQSIGCEDGHFTHL
jgi:hypothetical protein